MCRFLSVSLIAIGLVGCVSTQEPVALPDVEFTPILGLVAVQSSEHIAATELLEDLRETGVFSRVELQTEISEIPALIAIPHSRHMEYESGCDSRGENFLTSAMFLFTLPSCTNDLAYRVEFLAPESGSELFIQSDYKAVIYTSPLFLPMNLTSRWHWGSRPSRDLRVDYLRSSLLSHRNAIEALMRESARRD